MKLFNLGFLSYREWRVSHAMSHHIYPNTLHDLEVSFFEPFMTWVPTDKIKFSSPLKYIYWLISPIAYCVPFFEAIVKRVICATLFKEQVIHLDDILVPLIIPTVMTIFGNPDLNQVLKLWMLMVLVASFAFTFIGLNAAHHHPELYHEGDAHKYELLVLLSFMISFQSNHGLGYTYDGYCDGSR